MNNFRFKEYGYVWLTSGVKFNSRDLDSIDKDYFNKFIKDVEQFGESTIYVNGKLIKGRYMNSCISYDNYNEFKDFLNIVCGPEDSMSYGSIIPFLNKI